MCGRFTAATPPEQLERAFKLAAITGGLPPRYNVAPSQPVPAVVNDGRRVLEPLRWGLIPWWAKDIKVGQRMINARVETLQSKPAFKEALAHRRCIVLADGFFEWKKQGAHKVPYYVRRKDREPFAFAGLWDRWRQGEEYIRSCTLITLPPVGLFAELHNRMPALLTPDQADAWLAPGAADLERFKSLLVAPPPREWEAYPVSPRVNRPDEDSADLVAPAEPDQLSLLDPKPPRKA